MKFLCNAFSLSMLSPKCSLASIGVQRVTLALAKDCLGGDYISAVGHATTALVLAALLDQDVEVNRVSVSLAPGDVMVVAQFTGARLQEGATTLPAETILEWFIVRVTHLSEGSPYDLPTSATGSV